MAALAIGVSATVGFAQTVVVPAYSTWKYLDDGSDQGTAWRAPGFVDLGWKSGGAELGYGEGDEATRVEDNATPGYVSADTNRYITTYFRKEFTVSDPSAFGSLKVRLLRDDGAVVYLNGVEIRRDNLPTGTISYTTVASAAVAGSDEFTLFETTIATTNLVAGRNVLAVEMHQVASSSSDLSFDFELLGSTALPGGPAVTRGPYLQKGTPSSLLVRWRTDVASESTVRYGSDPGALNLTASNGTVTTEHEVALTGLTPDARYYYSVGTSTATIASGSDYTFFTPPPIGTAKPTRVWVLGDSGTKDAVAASVRNGYTNFAAGRYTDVWLMLGDNAYNSGTDAEYQSAVFNMYPAYLRQSVLWSTIGNHETAQSTNPALTIPYFKIFNFPTNGEAGGAASGTEKYYSFDYGRIHFVCLDSMTSSRLPGSAMLTWLENDLAATTADWIIAFWHHPPYTKGSHNSDTESELIQMRQNVLPILEAGGVDLVLSGHSHCYERSRLLNGHYGLSGTLSGQNVIDGGSGRDTGAYKKPEGLAGNQGAVYITAGNGGHVTRWVGGSTAEFNPTPHPAMFYSALHLGSLVFDVNGNRLEAKMIRETGAVDDYFTIVKDITSPVATTSPADAITSAGATLNGAVSSNGGATAVTFQYSTDATFASAVTTTSPAETLASDAISAAVSKAVTGLFAHTTYYFRARATNGAGTTEGAILSFTTGNTGPTAPDGITTGTTGDQNAVTIGFPGTDADGDVVAITAAAAGAHLSVDNFTATTVTFTPAADYAGDAFFSYTVSDGYGATATGLVTVTISDNDAPVITTADSVAEAQSAEGAIVNYPSANATDNIGVTSLIHSPASGSVFPIGTTTVNVSASDAAGNTGTGSFLVMVQDTTAPTISAPAGGFTPLTLTATPEQGGTAPLPDYRSQAVANDAVGVAERTQTPAPGSAHAPGTVTVTITARDGAGNTSAPLAFDVTVVAPEIAVEQPAGNDLVDGGSTVSFGSPVAGGAADRVFTIRNFGTVDLTGLSITIDGTDVDDFSVIANPTAPVAPGGSTSFTVRFEPSLLGGTGTRNAALHIGSNDPDEHPFDIALTGGATGDTTPPETTITSGPPSPTNSTSATITFTGSDDLTPMANLRYEGRTDDGIFAPVASPVVLSDLAEGTHTYEVRAKDSVNNVDPTPATYTWTVDLSTPETTITSGPASPTRNTTASIAFAGTDGVTAPDGLIFRGSLDGGAEGPVMSPVELTGLSDGSHSFAVSAVDAAGNADASPALLIWTVDTTPPVVSAPADQIAEATGPDGAAVNYPPATATDAVSSSPAITYSQASGTAFPIGTTPVMVTATDEAGNVGTGAFNVTVQDTTAPAITVPANISGTATSPEGALVSFSVSATDLVDGAVTATPDPASGSTFPIGTTTVLVTATDSRGNAGSESFTVTVTGAPELVVEQPAGIELLMLPAPEITFGNHVAGVSSAAKTLTVKNIGTVALELTSVEVVGGEAADFMVNTTGMLTSVPPGGATSFSVTFTPAAPGVRATTLRIASDDADESPFDIVLSGTGDNLPVVAISAPDTADEDVPVELTFTATDADTADQDEGFTWTIDAGDGSPVETLVAGTPSPQTGSHVFATPGIYTVTATATDQVGGVSIAATHTITIRDLTAPVFTSVSPNLEVPATSAGGAVVNYAAATATDNSGAAPAVTYSKASGSMFAVGTTPVVMTATDAAGNAATASFNIAVQPFTGDTDGDGMTDQYEIANGFDPEDANDGPLDSDGDLLTNFQEFQAGTNPNNAADKPRISALLPQPDGSVLLQIPTVNGKSYRIEANDAFPAGAWSMVADNVAGTGGVVPVPDPGGAGSANRVYRLTVLP